MNVMQLRNGILGRIWRRGGCGFKTILSPEVSKMTGQKMFILCQNVVTEMKFSTLSAALLIYEAI
jgi:hypothetical protein